MAHNRTRHPDIHSAERELRRNGFSKAGDQWRHSNGSRAEIFEGAVGEVYVGYYPHQEDSQMSNNKFRDQKIYDDGYRAGAAGSPKTANPHRDSQSSDEAYWDRGWEDGKAGVDPSYE